MDFKTYQEKSSLTSVYPTLNTRYDNLEEIENNFLHMSGILYTSLGLSNEAGEVLGKIKKVIRDYNCKISESTKKEISKELGDVLWYISNLAKELDLSLDDIARENLEKLFSRKERNLIKGDGDER
jgi:NTP pyrophosphatase (non-canonical NTP hydrolase)